MIDRELLELAAKAAGIGPILCYEAKRNCLRIGGRNKYTLFNPFNKGDDALVLATRLNMGIIVSAPLTYAGFDYGPKVVEEHKKDADNATRRAIVRAAAEIGKTLSNRQATNDKE
jgi:hypothetical protein